MTDAERRRKKPAVRLLEDYVLHVLGALTNTEETTTKLMMRTVFGETGNWKARLRDEFGLTPTVDQQLAQMWSNAQEIAKTKDVDITAHQFAEMVVEENFIDAIEMVTADLERQDGEAEES